MKIGYMRVSTLDQDEALQMDALKADGCEKFFSDKMSGSKFDRKGLNEALAFMRPGDALVVWKLDRLGRSMIDLIHMLNTFSEKGVEFVSLTEKIDTTSPGGVLIFHLFAALAEFERSLIRERTKAGLAAARARGKKGGRPRKLKTEGKIALARELYEGKNTSISEICSTLGISRATLYKYMRELKEKENSDG